MARLLGEVGTFDTLKQAKRTLRGTIARVAG